MSVRALKGAFEAISSIAEVRQWKNLLSYKVTMYSANQLRFGSSVANCLLHAAKLRIA